VIENLGKEEDLLQKRESVLYALNYPHNSLPSQPLNILPSDTGIFVLELINVAAVILVC